MPKCDCGAKHTKMPNIHSHWCKVMTETPKSLWHNFGMLKFKKIDNKTIQVIYKDGNVDLGSFDYEYRRGEFKSGTFNQSVHCGEFRSAVLQCIDFLVDSINDDRICEWRAETMKARKLWELENEPPPITSLELL